MNNLNNDNQGWKELRKISQNHCGMNHFQYVRDIEKLQTKEVKLRNSIVFLKRCLKLDVIPNGLLIKNSILKDINMDTLFHKFNIKVIKQLIHHHYTKADKIKTKIKKIQLTIMNSSSQFQTLTSILLQDSKNNMMNATRKTHLKKLESLINRQQIKSSILKSQYNNQNITKINLPAITSVKNLSKRSFTNEESFILERGLNFAFPNPQKNDELLSTLFQSEMIIKNSHLTTEDMNSLRMSIVKEVEKESKTKRSTTENHLFQSIKSLKSDKKIVILRADKGNMTVILDRPEYESKITSMLETGPYEQLLENPTKEIKKNIDRFCKTLHDEGKISKDILKYLTQNNERCPTFYGCPKIHKTGTPLRPIVDFRNSPSYFLAKLLVPILQSLIKDNPYNVKNSFELKESIKNIKIKRTESLVSFDVVSLFTKVPINMTLEILKNKLSTNISWKSTTKLTETDIINAVEICVSNTTFLCRGKFYKQLEGAAMGSPISPVFCEVFMGQFEKKTIQGNPDISLYRRYIDDIASIVKKRRVQATLDKINSFHHDIQFTIEEEENGSLPFLDVLLKRKEDGSFSFSVYRKKTHTDKYLNYKSHHHHSQKIAVIHSLAFRAFNPFIRMRLN